MDGDAKLAKEFGGFRISGLLSALTALSVPSGALADGLSTERARRSAHYTLADLRYARCLLGSTGMGEHGGDGRKDRGGEGKKEDFREHVEQGETVVVVRSW